MTKFGAVLPQTEIGSNPEDIRAYAQTVESLGYDYILVYDHVLGANPERPGGWRGPYTFRETFHEPMVLYGYLAGITRRLELVTGILILPQRQTALVAKQSAEVDLLSGGRLRLGVGIGWNQVEYISLNEDFHTRGARIEEQVQLLRELWTKPLVNFNGQQHTIPDAGINPLPVQRPIPVWFGASAEVALRRAARVADGWIANTMSIDRLRGEVEKVRAYVTEAGRDPQAFGIDARISFNRTPEDGWANEIEQLRAMDVSHICFNTMGMGFTALDQHLDALRRFKNVVG
jgi:probable F420-dependent oxidoreductase